MEVRVTRTADLGYPNLYAAYPIVDVETRDLLKEVEWDSRRLAPSVVGIFFQNLIVQIIRVTAQRMHEIKRKVTYELEALRKPFLAFNCDFDRFVIFGLCGRYFPFVDIQEFYGQTKEQAKKYHQIEVADVFNGNGVTAVEYYQKYEKTGNREFLEKIIQHNQSCLITEQILTETLVVKGALRLP